MNVVEDGIREIENESSPRSEEEPVQKREDKVEDKVDKGKTEENDLIDSLIIEI